MHSTLLLLQSLELTNYHAKKKKIPHFFHHQPIRMLIKFIPYFVTHRGIFKNLPYLYPYT